MKTKGKAFRKPRRTSFPPSKLIANKSTDAIGFRLTPMRMKNWFSKAATSLHIRMKVRYTDFAPARARREDN